MELLQNPKLIAQAWQSVPDDPDSAVEPNEKQCLENRLEFLDRQQERLLDLFQEEHLEKEAYLERKQQLAQEQQAIQNRLCEANQKTSLEQSKQALLAEVVVGNGEIVIKHIIPTDDDCRLKPRRTDMLCLSRIQWLKDCSKKAGFHGEACRAKNGK